MKRITFLVLLLSHVTFSCQNTNSNSGASTSKTNSKSPPENLNEVYKVEENDLLKDFMKWYKYSYYNIRLVQDFIGEDENSSQIDKTKFLQRLSSGNFIAFKVAKKDNVPVYKLYRSEHIEPDIKNATVQMAQSALTLATMEDKELPDYHFIDLTGNSFDKNSTKGKVMLIKCWFINCVACVKEFPVLNELVEQYKNRNDIRFISLALDSGRDLMAFLKKKPFSYSVVPEMENYMTEKLNLNFYPLHLLINKEGKIVKAANSIEDMIPYFKKEVDQSKVDKLPAQHF